MRSVGAISTLLIGAALGVGLAVGMGGRPDGGGSALVIDFADCESVGGGLLGQPTAAWTSLAFVPLGVWAAADKRIASPFTRGLLAATIAGVGIGSFLGHAAVTDWARRLDSLAIKLMLVTFIAYPVSRVRGWETPAVAGVWAGMAGGVLAIEVMWPSAARPMLVVLATVAAAVAATAANPRTRRWLIGGLILLSIGALAWWLGRSGGPLCAPQAVFQLHGVWHILAAAGIASVYQVYRSDMT